MGIFGKCYLDVHRRGTACRKFSVKKENKMENKCPCCQDDFNYIYENDVEQDGDTLWVKYWCRCKSCGFHWLYIEKYKLETAWIENDDISAQE